MNSAQQMRLLELVEKNADILITDNDPQTDERLKEVRAVFWDMASKVLNKMGEESNKWKDQQGWRKVLYIIKFPYILLSEYFIYRRHALIISFI